MTSPRHGSEARPASPDAVAARAHIEGAAAELRRARAALAADFDSTGAGEPIGGARLEGMTFDGTALEARVELACAAAAAIPADEAAALRPALLAVVADLDDLLADCRRERDSLGHRLADSSVRRRATSAYRGAR